MNKINIYCMHVDVVNRILMLLVNQFDAKKNRNLYIESIR